MKIFKTLCNNRYHIFKELRCKSNTIFFGYDIEENTPIAIKISNNHSLNSLAKLKNEVQIWLNVSDCPYVVSLLSIELINNRPAIVMELVCDDVGEKCDMNSWMQMQEKYSIEVISKFAIQFCIAMMACKQKYSGFVHGDIKPENILIDGNDIKICDISISNGTQGYIAPENEKNPNEHSELTDIYSLGITFKMLFNERMNGDADYISQVKQIIEKCGASIPEMRYRSFENVYSDLQTIYSLYNGQYSTTLKLNSSNSIDIAVKKSIVLAQLGDHQQVIEILTDALRNIKFKGYQVMGYFCSPSIWFNIANAYYNLHQYEDALDNINKALELTEDEYRLWDLKAHILYSNTLKQNHFLRTMACIEKALQLCPENIIIRLLKSRLLADYEKYNESMEILDGILEIESDNIEATRRKAINYLSIGLQDEAIYNFKKLLLLCPTERKDIIHNIVSCYIEKKEWNSAQNYLHPLYNENPNNYFTAWQQGLIHLGTKNTEKAYYEFNKSCILLKTEISFNPHNDNALEILHSVCSLLFKFKESSEYIKQACIIKKTKKRTEARINAEKNYIEIKKIEQSFQDCQNKIRSGAIEHYNSLFNELYDLIQITKKKYDDNNPILQYIMMYSCFYISFIYFEWKNYPKALSEINRAQQIYPTEPSFLYNKIIILHMNGLNEEALKYIEYAKNTYNGVQYNNDLDILRKQILSGGFNDGK